MTSEDGIVQIWALDATGVMRAAKSSRIILSIIM